MSIKDRFLTPEETLIVAIIENAVQDVILPPPKNTKVVQKRAIRWLESEANYPFSFNWCMDILEIRRIEKKHIFEIIQAVKEQNRKNIAGKQKELKKYDYDLKL